MDLKTFAACLIMTICFIKQSDAQLGQWSGTLADSGSTVFPAMPGGADSSLTTAVSLVETTTTNLFTIAVTSTGGGAPTFAFDTDGNPGTVAAIDSASGLVSLAAGSKLDFETTTSYVFQIVGTDVSPGTGSGTATFTLSITDAIEFTTTGFCLSGNSAVSGASVGTIATDQSTAPTFSTTLLTADFASFAITSAGVITTAAALSSTTQSYYTFTASATGTSVGDSGAVSIHVLFQCDSSGASQIAALLGVLGLAVSTALFN